MPRHPPHALHSLSHTPPTQPPPKQVSRPTTATNPQRRDQTGDAHFTQNMTCHKEPTHPPQSERACHNKQSDPPHTHQKMGIHGSERCSRPLSRSQTTTPHHPEPAPTGTDRRSRVSCSLVPKPQTPTTTTQHGYTRNPRVFPRVPRVRRVSGSAGCLIPQNPNSVSVSNPAPGWAGSCRHPSTGTTITLAGGPERASGVVCFHIFQRHHQRQDTNGPGLGVCSLERR